MKLHHTLPLARHVRLALLTLMISSITPFPILHAAEKETLLQEYQIPAGPLSQVLSRFAADAGILLSANAALADGKQSSGLHGKFTVQQALETLLKGSGLAVEYRGDHRYAIIPQSGKESTLPEVKVTAAAHKETAWSPIKGYIAEQSATGTKTDTSVMETPQSVSVVTKDFIQAIGAQSLREGMAYTPGVNVAPYGPDSRYDWIALRGIDAYSPGFYQDGLPWRNAGTFATGRIETYGIERLEILRGPASVLYGQSTAGGLINVVSKRPTATPLKEIQMQVGNYSREQLAGDFSGPLNEDGTVLYRITGLVRDADLPRQGMKDDRVFIAPSLTFLPSDKTSLTILSQYMNSDGGIFAGGLPEQGTLERTPTGQKLPYKTFVGDRKFNRFEQKQWFVGYLFEHNFNDRWTFRQNARYSEVDLAYWQVFGMGYNQVNPGTPNDPSNFRYISRSMNGSPDHIKAFTIDNQLQWRIQAGDWQHTLLAGLDYQRVRDRNQFYAGSVPDLDLLAPDTAQTIVIGDPVTDSKIKLAQTGFYLQDQIKWGSHWIATLGGRYDDATTENAERIAGTDDRFNDHKFTSRAGLLYLADNGLAPYFSYSESFIPTATVNPQTGKGFKPETGKQYEFGVRYQPPGSKSRYSAAWFNLERNNFISYDPNSGSPSQTGQMQVRGLELEIQAQPIENMQLITAYTYTPKVEVTASSNPALIGTPLLATPENTLSVWSDYRCNNGLKLGLGARYNGSTRGNFDSASERIPSFTLWDALVAYDLPHWTLAFNARNLTNKQYIANCSSGSCYYGEPRRAMLTATYRW